MQNRYSSFFILVAFEVSILLLLHSFDSKAQIIDSQHNQKINPNSTLRLGAEEWLDNFFSNKEKLSDALYNSYYYLLVELTETPTKQSIASLQKQGIDLLQFIKKNTYLAKIPFFINTANLKNIGIKAIQKFEVKDKIEKTLLSQTSPQPIEISFLVSTQIPHDAIRQAFSEIGVSDFIYQEQLNTVVARLAPAQILKIANKPYILWAEKNQEQAMLLGNIVREHYRVDPLENVYGLTGKNVNIGVWDGGFAGPHIDFIDRVTQVQPTNLGNVLGSHATHVVGNMAGAGTRDPAMRGVATEASIFVHDITNPPPFENYIPFEMLKAIDDYQIVITQNSYGSSPNCNTGMPYTVTSRSIDQLAYVYPYLTHHFAAGNSRINCASSAPANGGYRSTAQTSKNSIHVGGLERDNVSILSFSAFSIASSWGPSQDGSISPHVVSLGRAVDAPHPHSNYEGTDSWTGTSHSCPTVSGVSALLFQRYRELNANANPRASLVKALLCNGATDLGNPHPDYQFGFGRLNALKSLKILNEGNYLIDNVTHGDTKTYSAQINVPANTKRLKVMLCWTDPPAMPSVSPALINNLNLQIQHDPSATTFQPWVLNPFSPSAVAVRGIDNLNNIEQVTIDDPDAGTYTIQVEGANINFPAGGSQEFALVWLVEPEYIEVTYPAGGEKLRPSVNEVIQWDAEGIAGGDYTIEFYDGSSWSTLANVTIPDNRLLRYTWATPNIITDQAKIRISGTKMSGGTTSDESDLPFTIMGVPRGISTTIITATSQNNQIKLDWLPVSGADFYDIYKIRQFDNLSGEGKWQLVGTVAAPTTTFTSTGLVNGGWYFHTVRARTNTGVVSERGYATARIIPSGVGASTDLRIMSILAPANNICQTNNTVTVSIRNSGLNPILSGTTIPLSFQINAEVPILENLTLTADLGINEQIDYTFTTTANFTSLGENTLKVSVNLPSDEVKDNDAITLKVQRNSDTLPLSIAVNPSTTYCNTVTLSAQNFPVNTYYVENIPLATENMASANLVTLGDDDFKKFPIGFNFSFYGNTYDEFYINSNGFIGFDGFDHDFAPSVKRLIPNTLTPNNFIAFAWSDLDPSAAGTVKYQVFGTAPNRKLVVEFLNVPYYSATPPSPNRVNAQVILYETSNVVEIHSINIQVSTFASMIMGLESSGGKRGIAIAGRNDTYWSVTNEGLRFIPSNTTLTWFPSGESTPSITTNISGNVGFSVTENTCTYSTSVSISNSCDVSPLNIISLFPLDNSVGVPLNTNLEIQFNKQVKAGTGNITIVGGTTPVVIPVTGGVTGTVAFSGNTLTINPTADLEGNTSYHILIDAGAIEDFATPANAFAGISNATTWNFSTINHAPVLDDSGIFTLTLIDEDVTNSSGNTVIQIIASAGGDRITDIDANAQEGIAIIDADQSNGTWQYSLNSGVTWIGFGIPSVSAALLLPTNAKVRFVPNPNFHGTANFTFRAWDRTTGVAGGTADISLPTSYGGSTAFSVNTAVASIKVNARPTITPIANQVTNEDTPTSPINFTIGDPDNLVSSLTLTVTSSNSTLVPHTNISIGGTGANRNLVITPALNQFGGTVIGITVSDGRISQTINFILTVNPVNDPPVITNFTRNVANIFSINFLPIDFIGAYSDIENDVLAKIRIVSLPANGSLTFNSIPVTVNQEINRTDINLLRYTPNVTFVGSDGFLWRASDGTDYSTMTAQVIINVSSGNSAPVISSFSKVTSKNQILNFTISDFTTAYTDADNNALVKIKITELPSNGELFLDNILVTLNQQINRLDLDKLTYRPIYDYFGSDSFQWDAFDGYVYATAPAQVNLTILLGNQAPVVYDVNKNVNENTTLNFAITDFTGAYTDADNNDLAKIMILSLPTNGTLLFDNTPVTINQEFPKNFLNRLAYRPNPNFVGNDTFTWNASDGLVYANVSANVNINVIYVNKPPLISNIIKEGKENQQISFKSTDFTTAFADIENDELQKIKILSLPEKGILYWNKIPVNTHQEILKQDLDILYYVPNRDYYGNDSFTWNGAEAIQYATAPAQVIFNILPIIPNIPTGLQARAGSEKVWLTWDANPEPNIAYYEIYMFSTNQPLRLVGTSNTNSFVVLNLKNTTTYAFRIRAVTQSGIVSELSPTVQARPSIILAENNNVIENSLNIYPNPTKKEITVEMELIKPTLVKITLVDLLGREIEQIDVSKPQNSISQIVNLEKLANGMYFVRIEAGELKAVRKVVKE
jgi:hypothetical protein